MLDVIAARRPERVPCAAHVYVECTCRIFPRGLVVQCGAMKYPRKRASTAAAVRIENRVQSLDIPCIGLLRAGIEIDETTVFRDQLFE